MGRRTVVIHSLQLPQPTRLICAFSGAHSTQPCNYMCWAVQHVVNRQNHTQISAIALNQRTITALFLQCCI